MARRDIEVVHVGSACRDIAPEDPRGWRIGGGVMYAALTTARLGLRTAAVVGVDAESSAGAELDLLRDAGVDILRVPLPEGPIYHNLETPNGRVQTCVQVGVPLPVPSVPAGWLAAPGWSVVPVAGEVRDEWAGVVPASAHLAVAWQGFLRELHAGERVRPRPPQASPVLARADLVGVSRHDVGPDVPLRTLWDLLRPGADLLITEGDAGGLMVRLGAEGPDELLRYSSPSSGDEIDPTGAGDTFLAALHASGVRAAASAPESDRASIRGGLDLRFAAAAGSLVVEDWGLSGVPDLGAVIARAQATADLHAVAPISAEEAGVFWPEGVAPR